MKRLNVTLDDEHGKKLAQLADRMHIPPAAIARTLLSNALDEAEPDARNIVALLDEHPRALARAKLGRQQAVAGETIQLPRL